MRHTVFIVLWISLALNVFCDHTNGQSFCLWLCNSEQIISIKLWLTAASFLSGFSFVGGNDLLNMCFIIFEVEIFL